MRTTIALLLVVFAITTLPSASVAQTSAQIPAPIPAQDVTPSAGRFLGEIDFGGRLTSVDGDEARFQRFRDLRDGGTLDRLRLRRDTETWRFSARADHVGYRDQHYAADFSRDGRIKVTFDWDQIPLFISRDTRTLFTTEAPGVLRIDNAIQGAIQGGTGTIANFISRAAAFDTRSRRDIARLNVVFTPTRDLDLLVAVKSTAREGTQPWGTSFGHGTEVEVAVPIDHRTTDTTVAAEWANDRGLIRVGYDGSWFNNNIQTLIWDNPFMLTDAATSPSQGRTALWPSSTAHTVSGTGSVKLPWRSKATAFLSLGSWLQDEALLPFTINSAIAPIPLARQTAQADARITSMAYGFNSRPTDVVWLNARYRYYDFDNRTPQFAVGNFAKFDGSVGPNLTGGSEPFGYTRHFLDLDASFTPLPFAAVRVGYGREQDDRTHRYVETTSENVFRVSVDSTSLSWASVRALYEHSTRVGTGLDEEALDEIGEQVSLRQFDISDRDRDRVWFIVQLSPRDTFGVTGSVGVGRDRRPDAEFGLGENDHRVYAIGFDAVPSEAVSLSVNYGFEDYDTLQRSRQANPGVQFDDPTRDWSTRGADQVHTLAASANFLNVLPRTDLRFSYDLSYARSRYSYELVANSTLAAPSQLPPIVHDLDRFATDVKYALNAHLALGVVYWFDRYDVDEFGLGPAAISRLDLPGSTLLGYVYRPYRAHTVSLHLSYTW
jgi:MtrB/PioB family decaheme-associated outer membrane protein